ncbi:MAG: VCBS repeat-containing protein [Planctomycetaceae bacterium]|nr:VCBS repeat-containing protein [Planctomycetaceae bacterium]
MKTSSARPRHSRRYRVSAIQTSALVLESRWLLSAIYPGQLFPVGDSPAAAVSADFNRDGMADAAVVNQNEGTVSLLLSGDSGVFETNALLTVGDAPVSVAVGDFDGDGSVDLVTADSGSGSLSVLMGAGDGTFQSAQTIAVGANPRFVAAADLNKDGRFDLISAGADGRELSVLTAEPSGGFMARVVYSTDEAPQTIVVNDFNGDGHSDVICSFAVGGFQFFMGNGDGTLQSDPEYALTGVPSAILSADFNNDGTSDLAVALGESSVVSILPGVAGGGFGTAVNYVVGSNPVALAGADLNGDGMPDLVTGNYSGGSVSVLLNDGHGNFAAAQDHSVGAYVTSVAADDFNGDGRAEIAVSRFHLTEEVSAVHVLVNDGTGDFTNGPIYVWEGGEFLITGRFNGDANIDIASASVDAARILLGGGNATFQLPPETRDVGRGPVDAAAADFNGDGRLDLMTANRDDDSVSILPGAGNGGFLGDAVRVAVGNEPTAVAVADVNADGQLDALVANGADGDVVLLLGEGDGSFRPAETVVVVPSPVGLVIVDVVGDSNPDLVVATQNGTVRVHRGHGDGSFGGAAVFRGDPAYALYAGDLNNDGRADLVTADSGANTIQVFQASENGGFHDPVRYVVGSTPVSRPAAIAAEDLNADGSPDLVVANADSMRDVFPSDEADNNLAILTGNGDGTFQEPFHIATGTEPRAVVPEDFDGDVIRDILVVTAGDDAVQLLTGRGDGSFVAGDDYIVQFGLQTLSSGDFDNNGHLDLITAGTSNDFDSVLLGSGDGTFQKAADIPHADSAFSVGTGDFNGDGFDDIARPVQNGLMLEILLGSGDGTFSNSRIYDLTAAYIGQIYAADFDGNGETDLAVAGTSYVDGPSLWVLPGIGDGSFRSPLRRDLADAGFALAAGDFDGDGVLDLAAGNGLVNSPADRSLQVLHGNGDGTFSTSAAYDVQAGIWSLEVADFNEDGFADLAFADYGFWNGAGGNSFEIWFGRGTGTFEFLQRTTTVPDPRDLAALDLNNDSHTDLVILSEGGNRVAVTFGLGDGTFAGSQEYGTGGEPKAVVYGDFNGDGHQDLAIGAFSSETLQSGSRLTVLLHQGSPLGVIDSPVRTGEILVGDTLRFAGRDQLPESLRPGSFLWDFGNGRTSTVSVPGLVSFPTEGSADIGFIVSDRQGAKDPQAPHLTINVVPDSGSVPDLDIAEILIPPDLTVGQATQVHYRVQNIGNSDLIGRTWFDALYVSEDEYLDRRDLPVASVSVAQDVAAGGHYNGTIDVTLSEEQVGYGYLILSVDDEWQVLERRQLNNEKPAAVTATIPELLNGVPLNSVFQHSFETQYFRVEVPNTRRLEITFDDSDDMGNVEVFVRYGELPTRSEYDYRGTGTREPWPGKVRYSFDHHVSIPVASPGTWYVMARNLASPLPGQFRVTADIIGDLALTDSSPDQYGAVEDVVLTIEGNAFDAATALELIGPDTTIISPSTITVLSPTRLRATFDMQGRAGGVYSLRAIDPGVTMAELPDAIEVVTTDLEPNLVTNLISSPEALGWHLGSTFWVEVTNTGWRSMPAPLMTFSVARNGEKKAYLSVQGAEGYLPRFHGFDYPPEYYGMSGEVQFIASGAVPGLLQPKESLRIPISYYGWQKPWGGPQPFEIEWSVYAADNAEPVDWSLLEDLRPEFVTEQVWDVIRSNLQSAVGTTWGDFVSMLSENAAYLAGLGQTVLNVGELLQFEFAQAVGLSPLTHIAAAADVSIDLPGPDLLFARSFRDSLLTRNQSGPLGFGWSHNWMRRLEISSDGKYVTLYEPDGGSRSYAADWRGVDYYPIQLYVDETLVRDADDSFRLIEADGSVTEFGPDGRLGYVADANGNRVTAGYTGERLTSLTHSAGLSLTIEYNAAGQIAAITDPWGRRAEYVYDSGGQHLESVALPDGRATRYGYQTGHNAATEHALSEIGLSDGSHYYFTYDDQGRLNGTSRDKGQQALMYSYDTAGSVFVTDLIGRTSTFAFDTRGYIARFSGADGASYGFTADSRSRLTDITVPNGLKVRYEYDRNGNVSRGINLLGEGPSMQYQGPFDAVTGVWDSNGNRTSYNYDLQGNLTQATYGYVGGEDTEVRLAVYDDDGNPTSVTNRRGQTILFTYDDRGQLLSKEYPDGTVAGYRYDERGNLTQTTDPNGTTAFTYDAFDYLSRVDYPGGRFIEYTYDAAGRRSSVTDQSGHTQRFYYDMLGQLQRVTEDDGSGEFEAVDYAYDAAGRIVQKTLGNGVRSAYTYDVADRVAELVNYGPDDSILSRYTYTYDAFGNRLSADAPEGLWTYRYDLAGRLTSVHLDSGDPTRIADQQVTYSYDRAGNRELVVSNGNRIPYSVNRLNEYTQVGNATYEYDADGNLIRIVDGTQVTTYTYDVENRLVGMDDGAHTWTAVYDALDNQVVTSLDGVVTGRVFDPIATGRVVGQYDAAGDLTTRYTWATGLVSQTDTGSEAAYFTFSAGGNTSELTDAAGGLLNSYVRLPFGEVLNRTGSTADIFGFAGEFGVYADGSGLLNMRTRHYDAALGRFTSPDPLERVGDNLYTYAWNNRLSFIDPMGHEGTTAEELAEEIRNTADELRDILPPYRDLRLTSRDGEALVDAMKNALNVLAVAEGVGSIGKVPLGGATLDPGFVVKYLRDTLNKVEHEQPNGWYALQNKRLAQIEARQRIALFEMATRITLRRLGLSSEQASKREAKDLEAWDPNNKLTVAGSGEANYVQAESPLNYRINFENDAQATAPAQVVQITDRLDENLDLSTFEWTGFGFGEFDIALEPGRQQFEQVVQMTYDGTDLDVVVRGELNVPQRRIFVEFESRDAETRLPPGITSGFLPPEDESGRGQGFVSFFVSPQAGLSSGTEVRNIAAISFNFSETIATNQVDPHDPSQGTDPAKEALITIDAGLPASSVQPLPETVNSVDILVTWTGQDDVNGSGIAVYDVWYSDNGGVFARWLDDTTETSATFTGVDGHSYRFYTVATDNVGQVELPPAQPDASTTIDVSVLPGNVDGDGDFDGNDSFLIHLLLLGGTDQHIDQLKGASPLTAAQIRLNIGQLGSVGDVDGDRDFDANDSFLIHLIQLLGTDQHIDQLKGGSPLTAAQIRANVVALGGSSASAAPLSAAVRVAAVSAEDSAVGSSVFRTSPVVMASLTTEDRDLFGTATDAETDANSGATGGAKESAGVVAAADVWVDFRNWIDLL